MNVRTLGAFLGAALVPLAMLSSSSVEEPVVTSPAGSADPAGPVAWVRHLHRYPDGGLSAGLREALGVGPDRSVSDGGPADAPRALFSTHLRGSNRQVNTDSAPPLRQSNPGVAASLRRPRVAVAAANDAVGGGYQIMRTHTGGRSWQTMRQGPQSPTGEVCTGRTPSLAYSLRDDAFYLAAACATGSGATLIQLWRSDDDGRTWTPPQYAAQAVSNVDPTTGEVDLSLFYDWSRIAVDNTRSSPNFGRIYLTWTKFHILDSGESDYCPAQVAWTDDVPALPSDTVFATSQIGPDLSNGGVGRYTAAWTRVAVQPDGTVLAMYAQEGCNTGFDNHVRVARSTDGGNSFGGPVRVDRPGEFRDNPDPDDVLPDKTALLGISPSIAVSPTTGRIAVAYQNNIATGASGADIWVSTSKNGVTWRGRAVSLGKGGQPAAHDQFYSWVAADERGRFWMVWLDNRRDPGNHLIDAWEARSDDDARTWTSRRLSTRSFDPDRTTPTGDSSLGVVTAIAATRAAVYPIWPDARENDGGTTGIGELDLFTDVRRAR